MKVEALSNLVTTASGATSGSARAPARADATAPAQAAVDPAQLKQAAEAVNQQIQATVPNLRFSVDDDTGKMVVRIVDTATGDVIRQVPSEELLAISRSIDRLQGLLLNGQG
jgi:flagellar protein FlaG